MFDFTGKVVAVTGASSGLGKQVAEGYASVGADLVLLARRVERLKASAEEWSKKYGVKVLPVGCDITDETAVDAAFAKIDEEYGHLEVLFNAAGGEKGTGTALPEFSREDWDFTKDPATTEIYTHLTRDTLRNTISAYPPHYKR